MTYLPSYPGDLEYFYNLQHSFSATFASSYANIFSGKMRKISTTIENKTGATYKLSSQRCSLLVRHSVCEEGSISLHEEKG